MWLACKHNLKLVLIIMSPQTNVWATCVVIHMTDDRRRMPSDGNSSRGFWPGELERRGASSGSSEKGCVLGPLFTTWKWNIFQQKAPWSLNLSPGGILHFNGYKFSKKLSTILTLVGLIITVISLIENIFLSIIVFKILAENCKKKTHHFSLFKGNNSYKESSDNFFP